MNPFGLIIQETTSGLNIQFSSPNLDVNNPEIKATMSDERMLASQLANQSDVYAVQVTANYKVYSLIVTDITDFVGRAGFYAIRLYAPKSVDLRNFEAILGTIQDKYLTYKNSGVNNNQDYSIILSTILQVGDEKSNFVGSKDATSYFYYFDPVHSNLSNVFNSQAVHLVGKLYGFNVQKATDKNIALQSGLKPIEELYPSIKTIQIETNGLLKELRINDQLIITNTYAPQLHVICKSNDLVTYNTIDDKNFKSITSSIISIQRKYVPTPAPRSYPRPPEKGFLELYGNQVFVAISVLLIATIGWFTYDHFYLPDVQPAVHITESPEAVPTAPAHIRSNNYTFLKKPNPDKGTDSIYVTDNPALKDYIFTFAGRKWAYKKGSSPYSAFNIETIESFELEEKDSLFLIQELEKVSRFRIEWAKQKSEVEKVDVKPRVSGVKNTKKTSTIKQKEETTGEKLTNEAIKD